MGPWWGIAPITVFLLLLGCSPATEIRETPADPDRVRIRDFWSAFRLAGRLRAEGKLGEAVEAYRGCLKLDPRHEESLFHLGTSLQQLGRYHEAAEAYEQLLTLNPASGRALSQYAGLLSTPAPGVTVDLDRAEALLRRLLEVNKEQAGPFLQLGRVHLQRGGFDAAYEDFLLAARCGSPEGFAWAGYTAYLQGRAPDARRQFEEALNTQRRERKLAGAGIRAEGDVLPSPERPLTPLDRAALLAEYYRRELAQNRGSFRPEPATGRTFAEPGDPLKLTLDFDGDGVEDRLAIFAEAGSYAVRLHRGANASADRVWQFHSNSAVVDAAAADFNQDGRPDIVLACWKQGVRLFWNRGGGRWDPAGDESGLRDAGKESLSLAVLDYDRDGLADLFVSAHASWEDSLRSALQPAFRSRTGSPRLYRNLGGGRFEDVSAAAGFTGSYTTVRAEAADLDGDGWTDLVLDNGGRGAPPPAQRVVLKNLQGRRFGP